MKVKAQHYRIFKGETLPLTLEVVNCPDNAEVYMIVLKEVEETVATFKTSDSTLVLSGGYYKCELSSVQTQALDPGMYIIEGKVVGEGNTYIRPLGTILVLPDQVYKA